MSAKAINNKSRPSLLRHKTPEAQAGRLFQDEGVVTCEVREAPQGPYPYDGVSQLKAQFSIGNAYEKRFSSVLLQHRQMAMPMSEINQSLVYCKHKSMKLPLRYHLLTGSALASNEGAQASASARKTP